MRMKVKVGRIVTEVEVERDAIETIYEFAEEFASEIYDVVYNALITKSGEIKVKFEGLSEEQKKALNDFIKSSKLPVIVEDGYVKVEKELVGVVLMMIAKVAVPDDYEFETDNPIFNIVVGLTQRYLNGEISSKRKLFGDVKKCLKLAYPLKF